jgi:putative pyruvate formate lyase activating enzyme
MFDLETIYKNCRICPHECNVDRTQGEFGICGELATMRIASVGLHLGEESPLITKKGSGTLFFTGCSLHCQHCQNIEISQSNSPLGVPHSLQEVALTLLQLEKKGAANANFVTPTHFAPSIIESIKLARKQGFSLPIVYNTSGYEKIETLKYVNPFIDTYLLDIKTLDYTVAKAFCGSRDYPDVILKVVDYLKTKKTKTFIDDEGFIRGLLVRHLIFPNCFEATKEFLYWYAENLKERAYLSILFHFVYPKQRKRFPTLSDEQYKELVKLLKELKITKGYIQGLNYGSYTLDEL